MKTKIFLFPMALMVLPAILLSAGTLTVQDALIAKDVVARQPVEPGNEFSPEVGSLIFWTKIKTSSFPASVTHVWYYAGKEVMRTPLRVNSSSWRTWSRKGILSAQIGDWKVVVLDESGATLKEVAFKIIKPVSPPTP